MNLVFGSPEFWWLLFLKFFDILKFQEIPIPSKIVDWFQPKPTRIAVVVLLTLNFDLSFTFSNTFFGIFTEHHLC